MPASDVRAVLSVGRTATGKSDPKLREIVRPDLVDLAPIEPEMSGFDACFFCLGVASAGMTEANYRRVTFDIIARLSAVNAATWPSSSIRFSSASDL